MSELKEGVKSPPPPGPCDHTWIEISSKTPEEGKNDNAATAALVQQTDPPSAKGYLFENHCIDTNLEKLKIQKVSVMYQCVLCGQNQEVDIEGEHQIAECKNKKSADTIQGQRLKDIQTKIKGGGQPLAKINEGHKKAQSLKRVYAQENFETELVSGFLG